MADTWVANAAAGLGDGSSFANRAALTTSFVSLEASMSTGDTMHFSGETYNLTFILARTGSGKLFVGVNPTTGAEDGSIATFNAGSSYNNCMNGGTSHIIKNLEFVAAILDGVSGGTQEHMNNCKSRNNGQDGFQTSASAGGPMKFLDSQNNSASGIVANYLNVSNSRVKGNATGIYCEFSTISHSIISGNTLGLNSGYIVKCILDNNTTGLQNTSRSRPCGISQSSISNNTTAISTNAGANNKISESRNLFYNNGTKFGGTTSNIFSFGGSVDSIINPYTNQPAEDYTPSASAEALETLMPIGLLSEATNISYENFGLEPLASSGGGIIVHPGMNGRMSG